MNSLIKGEICMSSTGKGTALASQDYKLILKIDRIPDDETTMFEYDNSPFEKMMDLISDYFGESEVEVTGSSVIDDNSLEVDCSAEVKVSFTFEEWSATYYDPGDEEIELTEIEEGIGFIEESDIANYKSDLISDLNVILKDMNVKVEDIELQDLGEIELNDNTIDKDYDDDYDYEPLEVDDRGMIG